MFDSLGKSLSNLIRKLVTGTAIDKKAVEEILEDMKRVLLQSDVDVKLTDELMANIRKKCFDEKIPSGLTLREHVLKVIYEELVRLLGKESVGLIGKKRIMVVGLFGSGKCVHPDSLIPLSDGRVIKAEEFYRQFSRNSQKETSNGDVIIDISDKNVYVPSFNPETLKIENKKVTHLWKLKGKKLLQVYLDNGNDVSVRVTPEHPFFVLRQGQLRQLRTDELNEDDFVAVPRVYSTESSDVNFLTQLKTLDLDVKLNTTSGFHLNSSRKQIHENLPFKRNYCHLTINLKNGVIPVSLLSNMGLPSILVKYKTSKKFISFPLYLTSELAEFLGYLFGDGHLGSDYIDIVSEDREIIERVKFLVKVLFGLETKISRDLRTRGMYKMIINSKTLVVILNKIFGIPIGKKDRMLKIPQQIFISNLEIVRQFVKAYFDCDSSPSVDTREIELSSESERLIHETQLVLLRFGILSSISKKIVKGKYYWRLRISGRYAEQYAQKIGFRIKRKNSIIKKYSEIGLLQGCRKQDMIPVGRILSEVRMLLGFSIGEMQKFVNSYGQYEKRGLISRESLLKVCRLFRERKVGFIFKLLLAIKGSENIYQEFSRCPINGAIQQLIKYGLLEKRNGLLQLTQRGVELPNQKYGEEMLNYLEALALSDVCWLRVQKIVEYEEIPESLYDFTVEQTHSFIADGIIVHNTTTIAKLAKYFIKQGLKPALIALDYHRAAAPQQLQELGQQIGVPVHVDKNNNPYDAVKSGLVKFEKYDTLIFDTAGRNALDKELADELKKLNEMIKPDEVLLAIPADLGKVAKQQSEEFHKLVGVTGVIITKMDGTAKAGGALAATAVTGAKVKFIGIGERIEDLEVYNPERFVSRLLGLGDLETLLEKAKEAEIKPEKVEKIVEGKFTLQDFMEQIESMKKMGSLSGILKMIPGLGMANIPEELLETQEGKFKKYKAIIQSLTLKERENPDIIDSSRIKRCAKGSGVSESDVRELLTQYNQLKKVTKMLGGRGQKDIMKLMKQFGGRLPF